MAYGSGSGLGTFELGSKDRYQPRRQAVPVRWANASSMLSNMTPGVRPGAPPSPGLGDQGRARRAGVDREAAGDRRRERAGADGDEVAVQVDVVPAARLARE